MRTGCPEGRRSVNVLDDRHVRKSSICHSWCTCNVLAFLFFSARSRACSMGLHENGVRGPGAGPTGSCSAVRTGTGMARRGDARGGQQGSEVRASSLCAPLGAQARVGSLESPPKKKKRRHEAPCGKKKACALKREALQNANSRSRGREGGGWLDCDTPELSRALTCLLPMASSICPTLSWTKTVLSYVCPGLVCGTA